MNPSFLKKITAMKKMIPFAALQLLTTFLFAEGQGEGSSAAAAGESIPVDTVFLLMGVAVVAALVVTVVYSLSKAVRALAVQTYSKK